MRGGGKRARAPGQIGGGDDQAGHADVGQGGGDLGGFFRVGQRRQTPTVSTNSILANAAYTAAIFGWRGSNPAVSMMASVPCATASPVDVARTKAESAVDDGGVEMFGEGVQSRHRAGARHVAGDQDDVAAGKLGVGRELGGDRGFSGAVGADQHKRLGFREIDGRSGHPRIDGGGERQSHVAEIGLGAGFGERVSERVGQAMARERGQKFAAVEAPPARLAGGSRAGGGSTCCDNRHRNR